MNVVSRLMYHQGTITLLCCLSFGIWSKFETTKVRHNKFCSGKLICHKCYPTH